MGERERLLERSKGVKALADRGADGERELLFQLSYLAKLREDEQFLGALMERAISREAG